MSASNGRDAQADRATDGSHAGRGRITTSASQRVFLASRRRSSRESEDRSTKKENSVDGVVVAGNSTSKKRKAVIRERSDRPDSPAPERHPPRSTLHQPLTQRTRPNKPSALTEKPSNDANLTTRSERSRRMQSNSTDDDRGSRPQAKPNFTTVREARSSSRASTLYDRMSRRSSDSLGEIESLREQILILKKEADDARQVALEKQQAIDGLTSELESQKKLNTRQSTQLVSLANSEKKNEELFTAIQSNLQCQICWEMLTRPHVLTPCGHVYCMQCLQDWFKSSPAMSDDDEYDVQRSAIFRNKHCPCCRSRILLRPVELFLVKSLTSAFNTANDQSSTSVGVTSSGDAPANPPTEANQDGDPWAGLFPVHNIVAGYVEELDEEDEDGDGYDSDSQLRSETSSMGFYHSDEEHFYSDHADSHSASEEDEDEAIEEEIDDIDNQSDDVDVLAMQRFVRPPYAPPIYSRMTVLNEYPHVYGETLELLQRGATLLMIDRFDMRFDHQHGISVRVTGNNKLYVGWNITRPDIHSLDGADLVDKLELDLWDKPERWDVIHVGTAYFMAWRLVPEDGNGVPIPEVVGMYSDNEED